MDTWKTIRKKKKGLLYFASGFQTELKTLPVSTNTDIIDFAPVFLEQ